MNKLNIEVNLKSTLLGGQAHNWELVEDKYIGIFRDRVLVLKQKESQVYWQSYPQHDDYEFINKYFHLEHDYHTSLEQLTYDAHISRAISTHKGIRILKQDFIQTLFSFMLATNKNIPAIRKSLSLIQRLYGKNIKVEEREYYLFPNLDFFIEVSEQDLLTTGIGYRAKYLKHAAKVLSEVIEVEEYFELPYLTEEDIRQKLKSINGIGDKVADCIMVFALGYKNITPIDVWTERIIKDLYKNYRSKNYNQKRKWLTRKFGENTAIAGQYLFEYIRDSSLNKL